MEIHSFVRLYFKMKLYLKSLKKKKKIQGFLGDFVTWVFLIYDLIVKDCMSF